MDWSNLVGHSLGDESEYEIVAELGRGASSRIYRAWDRIGERDVAIKVIPNDADDRQGFIRRFEREVQAFEHLRHPNIVEVYGKDETEELVYLVMQCVTGGTLRAQLGTPLPISEAAGAIIQMAHALHHAHQQGVIHRDVKPANILVDATDSRRLLLTDFGIAKIQGMRGLTKSGVTIGTPEYMSPEQAVGGEVDHRADVYALGCVLYEALAGRPPFVGTSPVAILYQHVHARPAYLRGINTEVPRRLVRVVEQALAKRPEERFDTAKALAEALYPFTELRDSRLTIGSRAAHDDEIAHGSEGEQAARESGQTGQPSDDWGAEGLDALFSDDPEARTAHVQASAQHSTHEPPAQPEPSMPLGAGRDMPQTVRAEKLTPPLYMPLTSDGMLGVAALTAEAERERTVQLLPRLTPPQTCGASAAATAVMEPGPDLWPDTAGTADELTDELLMRAPRRHGWDADEPSEAGSGRGAGMPPPSVAPGGRKRRARRLWAAVVAALVVAVIASGAVLLSRGGTTPHETASSASSPGVLAPSSVATDTSGTTATAMSAPAGTASATAASVSASTPNSTPSAVPSATATGTPLPPQLTISPNPWSLSSTGLLSSTCSSGGTSQTVTNAGPHAVSWAWQSSGAPSPARDNLQYRLNGSSYVTGLPSQTALAAGGKDTLAVRMDCTSRTYTVSVLATDLVTGAQASFTFTLQVPGGF